MMIKSDKNGIILLTGSSATGKNTILEKILDISEELQNDIKRLIIDTTRPRRRWEVNWKDYNFIDKSIYLKKFSEWEYFGTEWTNSYNNHFYGTPRSWTNELWIGMGIPTCVGVAKEIIEALSGNTLWIHLIANQEEKRQRLMNRGISNEELHLRLTTWDTHDREKDADINLDTTRLSIDDVTTKISQELYYWLIYNRFL